MNYLFVFALSFMTSTAIVFEFTPGSQEGNWTVVDDNVMGGRSNGHFKVSDRGTGIFYGSVSLENNGGFSSVRHRFETHEIHWASKFLLKIKGDGKRYQFRVKSSAGEYQSYITHVNTTGEWQEVEIPIEDLYPTFRGRRLNLPNYPGEYLQEIAFLIANKKAEDFRLEIGRIELR